MTTKPENACPACGCALSPDAADGLCLKCLGRLGFLSESGDSSSSANLRLGDYEVLEEIARGGMGVVYRARQLSLNRIVALKVVLHGPFSSPDFVRRFRTEAEVVASLRHPNIVSIYDVGQHNGNHFISLEFIEGRSFAEVGRDGPLPARRAARYLQTIASAVEHAHQRGVLHRDLKPSNLLLDVADEPHVTDFGLAKLVQGNADLTTTGQVLGTPNFMPPEQAAGRLADSTAQSDIYSLGAILYELLTGRPPFQGETLQSVLAQVQTAQPVAPRRLNPGVPADLQTICLKCLQKEPARRYDSARALAEDLGCFLEGKPIHARPVSLAERAWLWCLRHPLVAGMSAALAAAVAIGVAGIVAEWRNAEFHARGELEQRLIAEKRAAETRLNLYAADIAVASQALQSGNLGLARRTLNALRPSRDEADLRGFEWRYLWNLCQGDQIATLTGHTNIVTCTAFSPDGSLLASGSQDGSIRVWNVATRHCVTNIAATRFAVWSVAFTPDGRELMDGCNEKVEFRHAGTWDVRTNFPGELAALSRTGELLATAQSSPLFWETAGAVKLWNWRTGQLLRTFDRPGRTLALSPDGRLLAVAGPRQDIVIWDTANGKLLRELSTANPIWSLNFSPDGGELLSSGWTSEAALWQLDGNAGPRLISGHPLHVWSAQFSGDGQTIATTSSDQTVRLWHASTLQPEAVLRGHSSEVWCAAFSPDNKWLASGGKDHNVLLWVATAPTPHDRLPHDSDFRPYFSSDGKWLITVEPASGSVLWDLRADYPVRFEKQPAPGRQILGFTPDSTKLVSFQSDAGGLALWNPGAATPDKIVPLEGVKQNSVPPIHSGFSPEQEFFFAIDAGGAIRIWNAQNGRLWYALRGPPPPIRNAILSSRAKFMAVSADIENVAHFYACPGGAGHVLAGHSDFVSGLAFSPDDAILATGSMDGSIRLWDTASGGSIGVLPGHIQEATDLAFSPDGRTLASLGRGESLKLWNIPTLREVLSRNDLQAQLFLAFAPDGRNLAVETDKNVLEILAAPSRPTPFR